MPPIATGDAWLPLSQMDEDAIVTKMEMEYKQMVRARGLEGAPPTASRRRVSGPFVISALARARAAVCPCLPPRAPQLLSIHSVEYPILGILGQRTNHDIDDPDPDDDGLEEEDDELLDGEEEEEFEVDDVQG
jgi:hypothetical protein